MKKINCTQNSEKHIQWTHKHGEGHYSLTASTKGVLINQGATQLLLILSFAHLHAKSLVSWFIAPASREKKRLESEIKSLQIYKVWIICTLF